MLKLTIFILTALSLICTSIVRCDLDESYEFVTRPNQVSRVIFTGSKFQVESGKLKLTLPIRRIDRCSKLDHTNIVGVVNNVTFKLLEDARKFCVKLRDLRYGPAFDALINSKIHKIGRFRRETDVPSQPTEDIKHNATDIVGHSGFWYGAASILGLIDLKKILDETNTQSGFNRVPEMNRELGATIKVVNSHSRQLARLVSRIDGFGWFYCLSVARFHGRLVTK